MLRSLLLATLILIGATAGAGLAPPVNLEEAAESANLDIRLFSAESGRIVAKACDYCESMFLTVNAATRVYLARQLVPLRRAEELADGGATVLYDPHTLIVTRIMLWNDPPRQR